MLGQTGRAYPKAHIAAVAAGATPADDIQAATTAEAVAQQVRGDLADAAALAAGDGEGSLGANEVVDGLQHPQCSMFVLMRRQGGKSPWAANNLAYCQNTSLTILSTIVRATLPP